MSEQFETLILQNLQNLHDSISDHRKAFEDFKDERAKQHNELSETVTGVKKNIEFWLGNGKPGEVVALKAEVKSNTTFINRVKGALTLIGSGVFLVIAGWLIKRLM